MRDICLYKQRLESMLEVVKFLISEVRITINEILLKIVLTVVLAIVLISAGCVGTSVLINNLTN